MEKEVLKLFGEEKILVAPKKTEKDGFFISIKYMVFAFPYYYPSGGWKDFQGFFNSLEDAKYFVQNIFDPEDLFCGSGYAHIVENGEKIVWKATYDFRYVDGYDNGYEWKEEKI